MISLDLMKTSEVRKAGDRPNCMHLKTETGSTKYLSTTFQQKSHLGNCQISDCDSFMKRFLTL